MFVTIIPIEIIQNILSYIGNEYYQDKDNKTQIRFIHGVFDDVIGYLFKDVSYNSGQEHHIFGYNRRISLTHIIRPGNVCNVMCTFYDNIEHEYEIICYFYKWKENKVYSRITWQK